MPEKKKKTHAGMPDDQIVKYAFMTVFRSCVGDMSVLKAAEVIGCSPALLRRTVNPSEDDAQYVNYQVIACFCHYYHIPMETILFPEEFGLTPEMIKPGMFTIQRHSKRCEPLDVEGQYRRTLYGYCHSTTGGQIDSFTLTLGSEQGDQAPQAVMELHAHNNYAQVEKPFTDKTLKGYPMRMDSGIIYVMLQDLRTDGENANDDLFFLAFRDPLYPQNTRSVPQFCYGALLTLHRHSDRYPELQAFVLFDAPPDTAEAEPYVRGLLKLSRDSFYIREKDLKEICAQWKKDHAGEDLSPLLQKPAEKTYLFARDEILVMQKGDVCSDAAGLLLTMMNRSLSEDKVDILSNDAVESFFLKLPKQTPVQASGGGPHPPRTEKQDT